MLLFKKRPQTVDSVEFATAAWELIGKSGKHFYSKIETAAEYMNLESEERFILAEESLIAHLWAVSHALHADRQALDALHERYFIGHYNSGKTEGEKGERANAAQSRLLERYDRYYKAFGPEMKGGHALASEMAQSFFPKRQPVLNAILCHEIYVHFFAFMMSVLKFRKRYILQSDTPV